MTDVSEQDVAIIGMHCRFPGVDGLDAYERLLREGRNALAPQIVVRDGERQVELSNVLEGMFEFDAGFFGYTPGEARILDPQHRVFLESAWHVLEHAGHAPRSVGAPVGVFAGVSTSFYMLHHLWSSPEIMRPGNDLSVMVGNDKDHLTSRVAYDLDLRGPCVTVQASCATSLVATHMACESLLGFQCDLAIAGGITLRMPGQKNYRPRGDGLLSEDGHLRAFDESASGTVYSSGVAVVLLKRALDAIRDGDRVWALISGAAVNNDGAQRAGYTAPGVEGQTNVIVEAQRVAGVVPSDVPLVEAHGSGTPLGDPIELEALRRAFRREGPLAAASCAIGSAKTNIGHVEMASGAAGLIKAALSVHHGCFYPSLGFTAPNPRMALADSPFYVNTTLRSWPVGRPRVAGVSAFGLGGTNAHVVLRGAPARPPTRLRAGPSVLVASAHSEPALRRLEEALVPALSGRDDDLADVCHTLQVGREPGRYRKAVVVAPREQAAVALRQSAVFEARERPLALVIDGSLRMDASATRVVVSACPEIANTVARLFGDAPEQLGDRLTELPEPARTFVSQVLLGSLLIACAGEPRCVIGDGVGVHAAAVLAGASSVDDAWRALGVDAAPRGSPAVPLLRIDPARARGSEIARLVAEQGLDDARVLVLGAPIEAAVATGAEVRLRDLLETAAALWRDGLPVDWERLRGGAPAFRVPLPGTSFQRDVHCVTPSPTPLPEASSTLANETRIGDVVRAVWEVTLGIAPADPDASLFELGGHSLLAMQILQELRVRLRVDVPIARFFAEPTLAGLSRAAEALAAVEQAPTEGLDAAPDPEALHAPFPLTDVQEAYFVGRRASLGLGNISTHIYLEFEFPRLDLGLFEDAVNAAIARHAMLRAVVLPDGTQRILEQTPRFRIDATSPGPRMGAAFASASEALRARLSHRVHDCAAWPLFSIDAVCADEGPVCLHASFDLLVADAWSLELFLRDVSEAYHRPERPLPALDFTFRDYVVALRRQEQTPAYERARRYWESRAPALPPGPALPLRVDPSAVSAPAFTRRARSLRRVVWRRLAASAAAHELTPTVALLAAFAEVLARWSADPRFTLNLTLFNRPPIHPQIQEIIGDFTSLTLLELDTTGRGSFVERAQALQARLWEDLDHRAFSGVRVARLLSRARGAPVGAMPVVFTSLLGQEGATWGDGIVPIEARNGVSQTPQVWLDHQVRERNGELLLSWDAVDQLFDPALLDAMFSAYVRLLEDLATSPAAWQARSPLALARVAPPVPRTPLRQALLHQGFAAQARRTPEAPAVLSQHGALSYAQLDRAADHVARALDLRPGEHVAVLLDRGWRQVAAAHGVLRAGGVYVPLDPALPPARRRELLAQARAARILTEPDLAASLAEHGPLHLIATAWLDEPVEPIAEPPTRPDDLAYVIFTSGSTGRPKGVMIEHAAALNTVDDINERFAIGPTDRLLALSAASFDLSIYDLFGPLAVGAALIVPEPAGVKDPRHWRELGQRWGVTLWNTVPALMQMLVAAYAPGPQALPSLRLAMLSGDWIPVELPDQACSCLSRTMRVVSLGGATECAIWSIIQTLEERDPTWTRIPYGVGLRNQPVFVLDEHLAERPVGVVGEIHIGGAGLARGYLDDPERTAARFVVDPGSGERLYKTGDLGRYLPDGRIEILGRADHQVKIQGFRVELGEIEHALAACPGVGQAVVVPSGDAPARHLVAFAVPAAGTPPPQEDGILTDPAERLAFKVARKGLRRCAGERVQPPVPQAPTDYLRRRSFRNFEPQPISLAQLGGLLAALTERSFDGLPFPKRRYGSAGGLYPVQTYVLVHADRVEGLAAGVWYHDPARGGLVSIRAGAQLSNARHAPPNRALAARAAFSLFFVADLDAIVPMYGHDAGFRFAMLETGAMCQLLEEEAPRYEVGLCQVGLSDGEDLAALLALGASHRVVHAMLGGHVSFAQHDEAGLVRDASVSGKSPPAAEAPTGPDLRAMLSARLPEHMVPVRVEVIDALPLTSNGKIDRAELSRRAERGGAAARASTPDRAEAPVASTRSRVAALGPDELAGIVEALWCEALGLDAIAADANFFELGGTSLHLVRIQAALEAGTGQEVAIADLFRLPRISDVVGYLRALAADPDPAPPAAAADDEPARAAGRRRALESRRGQRGPREGKDG